MSSGDPHCRHIVGRRRLNILRKPGVASDSGPTSSSLEQLRRRPHPHPRLCAPRTFSLVVQLVDIQSYHSAVPTLTGAYVKSFFTYTWTIHSCRDSKLQTLCLSVETAGCHGQLRLLAQHY